MIDHIIFIPLIYPFTYHLDIPCLYHVWVHSRYIPFIYHFFHEILQVNPQHHQELAILAQAFQRYDGVPWRLKTMERQKKWPGISATKQLVIYSATWIMNTE